MPAVTVRTTTTVQAVFTGDADWEDVVREWMIAEGAPDEAITGYMVQFREGVAQAGLARPWLVDTPQGIGVIPPHEFANYFEDVAATDVLMEIFQEMAGHADKGYTLAHDDAHNTADFVGIIRHYIDPLATPGNTLPDAVRRHEFIKAASVAVQAVNKIDRAKDVRTFSVD